MDRMCNYMSSVEHPLSHSIIVLRSARNFILRSRFALPADTASRARWPHLRPVPQNATNPTLAADNGYIASQVKSSAW